MHFEEQGCLAPQGQSGSPGGRPKVAAVIGDLARDHGPEAIARLIAMDWSTFASLSPYMPLPWYSRALGARTALCGGHGVASCGTVIVVCVQGAARRALEPGVVTREDSEEGSMSH